MVVVWLLVLELVVSSECGAVPSAGVRSSADVAEIGRTSTVVVLMLERMLVSLVMVVVVLLIVVDGGGTAVIAGDCCS